MATVCNKLNNRKAICYKINHNRFHIPNTLTNKAFYNMFSQSQAYMYDADRLGIRTIHLASTQAAKLSANLAAFSVGFVNIAAEVNGAHTSC